MVRAGIHHDGDNNGPDGAAIELGSRDGERRGGRNDHSAAAAGAALRAGHGDGLAAAGKAGEGPAIDTATLCRLLSLLADKTRLRILWLLADGERSVGNMTAELGLPQPTVSHHLAWLRTLHLVSPRRAGKNVFYALGKAARGGSGGALTVMTGDAVITIARRAE